MVDHGLQAGSVHVNCGLMTVPGPSERPFFVWSPIRPFTGPSDLMLGSPKADLKVLQ